MNGTSYVVQLREWLQGRINVIGEHPEARVDLAERWGRLGLPTLRSSDAHTLDELAAIEKLLVIVEGKFQMPFPDQSRPVPPTQDDEDARIVVLPHHHHNHKGAAAMSNSIPLSDLESSPSAKFETLGDKHAGVITAINQRQQTDISNKPRFFDDGTPMMLWVITIEEADGETAALFAKGGKFSPVQGQGESMLSAIGTAVRAAGAGSVDVGGTLAVAFTGMGEAKLGQSPPKLYTAQYRAPAPATASVPVDLFAS